MSTLLSISIVTYESICCKIFFDIIMNNKKITNYNFLNYIIYFIVFAMPGILISNTTSNYLLKALLIILLYIFIALTFYDSKLLTATCCSIILYITIVIMDYFSLLIVMSAFSKTWKLILTNYLLYYLTAMISKTLLFIGLIIYKRIAISSKPLEVISRKNWLILMLLSFTSIICFIALMQLCETLIKIPSIVILAAIGLLFSELLVYYFLENTAKYDKHVRENALVKKQLDLEMDSIISLKNSYDMQRKLMHDYKNQITTLCQMLDTKKYDLALSYAKNLSGEVYYCLYHIKTNHDIIDLILNQKDQAAQKKDIILDIRSEDLSSLNLPAENLVIIISNVLDNAIEACQKVKTKKIIKVKLSIENTIFIFSVINPVEEKIEIVNNRAKSTKIDSITHGLGLQIIAAALKQLDGDYNIDCDDNYFQFTAMVKLNIL